MNEHHISLNKIRQETKEDIPYRFHKVQKQAKLTIILEEIKL